MPNRKNCSFKKDEKKLTVSRRLAKMLTIKKFQPQSHYKNLLEILLIVLEATYGWLHSIFIMNQKLDIFILTKIQTLKGIYRKIKSNKTC